MKYLTSFLVIFGILGRTYGLDCYSCTDTEYNGEALETCFTTVSGTTTSATCAADSGTTVYYCSTKFTVEDGVTTGVVRACAASTSDEDTHSDAVPTADRCITVLSATGDPTATTECYYHCSATDHCNTENTASLKQCPNDCTPGQGSCNYITGVCVCDSAWSGTDCNTAVTSTASGASRKCVQCNSEIDSGCSTSTTSVDCPGTQAYCSTRTSTIFDGSDAVIRTVTTKACTSAFKAVDQCVFNDIHTDSPISDSAVGYSEFNCFSTCDTNDCNTNTADGVINGNEAVVLQCVVCSDTTGDGTCNTATARQACPSGSTHCKHTAIYHISDRVDLSYTADPGYDLVSVVRECATAAVTRECTEASVGSLSFKKVTCTETCQGDGCNVGWPARPECITCSSHLVYDTDDYDQCLENPPMAAACTNPYEAYCVIQESGIRKGSRKSVEGYPRRITRGCHHSDIGTACSTYTPRDTEMESCNRTCTTDGCNVGSGGLMPVVTLLTFLLPAAFGMLTQRYF
uniref:cell death abnormality protein 1-like n=1 Tax=Styela clava TaxID=7725 RepID=UPI00193A1DEE|nr:cell death abnormality protein 1-like [Styela clava]